MTANLDESTPPSAGMVPEGFPGQRLLVVPRAQIASALATPGTSNLIVTDCGFFPDAVQHGRSRPEPIGEAVVIACVQGQGCCETPNGTFAIRPGEVAIVPPPGPLTGTGPTSGTPGRCGGSISMAGISGRSSRMPA